MNRRERVNEDQCQFFGFSPMALGDEVYNVLIESWEKQIDDLLQTAQWSKVKKDKRARAALINLMFQKDGDKSLTAMSDLISEYAHVHVFSIPDHVVLPGTEPLQQLGRVDTVAVRRRATAAERRAEEAKRRGALLRAEDRDVHARLQVLRELAKKLGYVKPESRNTSMRVPVEEEENRVEDYSFHNENKENNEGDRTTVEEKMEDTVASKEMEMEDMEGGDTTLTGENMEETMERSLTMEE